MANTIERTYTIPLRREFLKVQFHKRAKKATKAVKEFLVKHMKCQTVKLGKFLNEELWKNGMKNPPPNVKINVVKKDDKVVAELFGKELVFEKKAKETKKGGIAERLKQKLGVKEEENVLDELKGKTEAVKDEKVEKAKIIEKEQIERMKEAYSSTHKHPEKMPDKDHSQETHPPAPKHL